jgi:protein phosphatase
MPIGSTDCVCFGLTHAGKKKPNNEDCVDWFEPRDPLERVHNGNLYLVADGVGGGSRGEKASQYAVQKVLFEYYQQDDDDLSGRLTRAIQSANTDIFAFSEESGTELMGTTLVAAAVRGAEAVIASVGDSRAYLMRGADAQQVTHDHSLIQKLIDNRELSPQDAQTHPRKNVILRSVGAEERVDVDVYRLQLQPGDRLLLCSDGLHKYFPHSPELANLVNTGTPEQSVHQLVNLANERGGSDNISALIVAYDDGNAIERMWPERATEDITQPGESRVGSPRRRISRFLGFILVVFLLILGAYLYYFHGQQIVQLITTIISTINISDELNKHACQTSGLFFEPFQVQPLIYYLPTLVGEETSFTSC